MDNLGAVFYDPYRPQPFGEGMAGQAAYYGVNMLGAPFGFQMQAPTGYSNAGSLWSRMQTDRYHQQAMALAGDLTKQRIGNVMASLMAPAMNGLPGLQFTQQQQQAMQNFAGAVSPMLYNIGTQSQQGRFLMDMAAGGYNQANTLSAYVLNRKTMVDPVARGGSLSFEGIKQQSETFFNEMFEGTPAERRARTMGFLPGEIHNMQSFLARQGRLGGIGDMQSAMNNPTFARAMEAGSFTDKNLLDLGMGNAKALEGQDLNDPEVQKMVYKVNASKQRGEVQQLAKVSAAIKDILVDSGIPGEITNIMSYLGKFTERYSTQIGGSQTSALLRQSHAALKEFGYGANEMVQMQEVAAQTAEQFGYEDGFAPTLARNQSVFMGSLLKNQRFAGASYGRGNAFQQGQMRAQMEAGFGKSTAGSMLGTIALLAKTNKIDESTPEGKRIKSILRDIESSNYIGDQDFVGMSPEQQAELVAKGLGVSTDRVYQTMGNKFPLEAIIQEKNITRLAGQFAEADMGDNIKAASIRGIASEFDDLDLDQARAFTELIGDAAVKNISENPLLADRETMDMTSGGMMLSDIEKKAQAGDANARALLERAGKTREEQMKYFEKIASYSTQSIEGQYGNSENLHIQLGKRTQAELGQYSVSTNMEAFKKSLLSQTSLGSMADLITSQMKELEKAGATMGEGADPITALMEGINKAVGGNLSEENQGAIADSLKELGRLRDEKKAAAEQFAKDGDAQAAKDAAEQYAAEIEKVIKEIQENAGIRLKEEGEVMGMTQDKDGNWVQTAVPKEVAQEITANFGGVTINLGDDAVIQIRDAIVRTERGNSNTIGNQ